MLCDFAQYYNIHDLQAYPPDYVGMLVLGLPDDSRYKRALAGIKVGLTDVLLSLLLDQVNIIRWMNTKDGHKGRNIPESISKKIIFVTNESKSNHRAVKREDFEKEFYEEGGK